MSTDSTAIAVIGVGGRFPGADDVETLWRNLRDGVESVRPLDPDALRAAGVSPELLTRPGYVPVAAELRDADCFDADLFDVPAHEARLMDPQHRLFLECVWAALEDAGYPPTGVPVRTGVFGSTSVSSYLVNVLAPATRMEPGEVDYPVLLGNDKDFLATRVSYKLGLTGPSVTVQSACSGSLTAVHLACQSLLEGECSLAVAGGVSISVPQARGYLYREGGILSADGHCRVFDAEASGTVKGSGCGVVVLRPLADALAAGDHVHAVIRGTAVNNDGSDKVGFTAPSPAGQQEVIREALQVAGVPAADVGYVEAHGTGTALGDPIEVRALAAAHRADGAPPSRCFLGSAKANLGHLDAAAGVTGLIKTALVLRDQVVPGQPTLRTVSPALELDGSPYVVLRQTEPAPFPLRAAAVSSFGLGGTNAHAVLVPADPDDRPAPPPGPYRVLLSAPDPDALRDLARRLHERLAADPGLRIDDVALTLARGRAHAAVRTSLVAADTTGLRSALAAFLEGREPAPQDDVQAAWAAGDDAAAADVGDLSRARRVPLPGRAFRRTRHWVDAPPAPDRPAPAEPAAAGPAPASLLDGIRAVLSRHLATEVGADDDVFDLGADSMSLVEIVTDLRDELGIPIRFEDAERARTAAELAARFGAPAEPPDGPSRPAVAAPPAGPDRADERLGSLVPVRRGSGRRTVFLVHPAGGTTVCYTDLARHLTGDDTVYAIGLGAGAEEAPSIRRLARRYVDLVRGVQPSGPYLIGGYSFGGNVAVEMALQLEAAGEQVEQVVLFDAHPPEAYVGGAVEGTGYVAAFPVLLRALFPDVVVPDGPEPRSLAEAIDAVRRPSWSDSTVRELESFFTVWRHNHEALKRHYPDGRVRADVVLLRASEEEDTDLERLGIRRLGKELWRRHVAGDLRLVPVPGDHFSMFRDPRHVGAVARAFDAVLREGPPADVPAVAS
ncbi:beta-ketoacyl synthase N-terminal-like domain-containing protein [Geodermatophilus sp. SYSU D00742]